MTAPERELIYVGDPMCSWCWGFAPELDELRSRHRLDVQVVVGGLRPGPAAEPMTDRMAAFLRHHWEQVAARSGQPFDHAILDRRDWTYDTEPAARAVVAFRELAPDQTLAFFSAVQRAFYAEGVDVTDLAVFPELAAPFEIDGAKFADLLASEESRRLAHADFDTARRWGVTGFPTLLLRAAARLHPVAVGWRPAAAISEMLVATGLVPDPAAGESCGIGEIC